MHDLLLILETCHGLFSLFSKLLAATRWVSDLKAAD
jgi:hypothetical protein